MKVAFMGELESAIAEWVSKNGPTDRACVGTKFGPFWDHDRYGGVQNAIDNLIKQGVLIMDDGRISFKDIEDDESETGAPSKEAVTPLSVLENWIGSKATAEFMQTLATPKEDDVSADVFQNPAVHSPPHYTRGGIETIDFIEAKGLNFHLGNVVKYVSRAGFKQDAVIQDLEKSLWYLTREINRLKKQEV
jgi:hypothetical protein